MTRCSLRTWGIVVFAALGEVGFLAAVCGTQADEPLPASAQQRPVPAAAVVPLDDAVDIGKLRKQYRYESLRTRLGYEARLTSNRPAPKLSADVRQRLEALDEAHRASDGFSDVRSRSLAMLHSDKVREFAQQPGFGMSRMIRIEPSIQFLTPPAIESLPLADIPPLSPDEEYATVVRLPSDGAANPFRMPPFSAAMGVHQQSESLFASSWSFGHIQDRDHVAGFQSHAFLARPELAAPAAAPAKDAAASEVGTTISGEKWLIGRLELVSLLKHAEPAVYVSEHLPRMDQLADAVTRPLNSVEETGLAKLQRGEDLAIEATPNRIRMLGALRASKQCMECHDVQRGELLGAFSYEFQRDPPVPLTRGEEPPAI